MAPDQAAARATVDQEFDILLQPLSHPELGDIRVEDELFAVGRNETPFSSYDPAVVADLSRRHARIFCEFGGVYVADLGSKNGTTVDGVAVRQKPARLRDGNEICFGRLCYRVRLSARAALPRSARLASLSLVPERGDLGIQPIVIGRFPFLVSKADESFARYKDDYPHQVSYLSRRHAHIFLKGGLPYIEDLGSTNGTFVAGERLEEHAVPLRDGELVAFGGHHFVYRVRLQTETAADTTLTRSGLAPAGAAAEAAGREKTTFVASADSFLDIFCLDQGPAAEENLEAAKPAAGPGQDGERPRRQSAVFLSELGRAFAGSGGRGLRRVRRWGLGLAAGLAVLALASYWRGGTERELRELLASGRYAEAAALASRALEAAPEQGELRSLATEALLKANVPAWLASLKARQFDRADAILAGMKSGRNADLNLLVDELEWMGRLEKFVLGRGGPEAPIRIYGDEAGLNQLLGHWDQDTQGHQRAFDTIASYVPEFKDAYAEALSHLRRLQSDNAVYLAAIDRLKAAIAAELERDRPEALSAVLKEYAEKYPRLGGLDQLGEDLRHYLEIENAVRAPSPESLLPLMARVRFSTPPFQERLRALSAGLPPPAVVEQYAAAARAWREGQTQAALAGWQGLAAAPWAAAAARQVEKKQALLGDFAELQKARGGKGYDDRLLSFYGRLDPAEDIYFIRAIAADLAAHREPALKRAEDLTHGAEALWRQYRENGGIAGDQRSEAGISGQFGRQARLLAEAEQKIRLSQRIYGHLQAEYPAQWKKARDEIEAEAQTQRGALLELRSELDPGLLRAKLALLDGGGDDEPGPAP